jgi:hypothetical protein
MTVLVTVAIVDTEHKPAFELAADTQDTLQVLPTNETAIVDFVRTLLRKAQLEGLSGDVRLFAGRVEEV